MKNIKLICVIVLILSLIIPLAGCREIEAISIGEGTTVKNVIILIGDGMGFAHIEGTKIYNDIQELNMEKLPYSGEVITSSLSLRATDSAAAATAMATGNKTKNKSVGMYKKQELKNITEYAIEQGKRTGIVVTKPLTDATPAGFSAHVTKRSKTDEIAVQQINSGIDIMFGEGISTFNKYTDLIADNNYSYINTKSELEDCEDDKILGIFDSLTPNGDISLSYLSEYAINALNKNNDNGFFLMIEGSKIDSKSHDNDFVGMTEELLAFDEAVKVAMEFAVADGNTMVIVTADHETGKLIIPDNATIDNLNDKCFHSGGHTKANVPYFSYGGMSPSMPKIMDNTHIFIIIMWAFGM